MSRYYDIVLQKYSLDRHGNLYFVHNPITVVFPWMESSGLREKREGSRKYEIELQTHINSEIQSLISFIWQLEQKIIHHLNFHDATFHSCIQNGNIIFRIPTMQDRINLNIIDDNNTSSIRTYFDIRSDRQIRGKLIIKSIWKIMQNNMVTHYGLYICLMEANLRYPSAIRSSSIHNIESKSNDERRVQWTEFTESETKDESV